MDNHQEGQENAEEHQGDAEAEKETGRVHNYVHMLLALPKSIGTVVSGSRDL